jgi:hypothetical protein
VIISIKLSRSEETGRWLGDVEFSQPVNTIEPVGVQKVALSYLAVNALKVLAEAECMGINTDRPRIKVSNFTRDVHGVTACFTVLGEHATTTQVYNLFAAVAEPHGFTVRA